MILTESNSRLSSVSRDGSRNKSSTLLTFEIRAEASTNKQKPRRNRHKPQYLTINPEPCHRSGKAGTRTAWLATTSRRKKKRERTTLPSSSSWSNQARARTAAGIATRGRRSEERREERRERRREAKTSQVPALRREERREAKREERRAERSTPKVFIVKTGQVALAKTKYESSSEEERKKRRVENSGREIS